MAEPLHIVVTPRTPDRFPFRLCRDGVANLETDLSPSVAVSLTAEGLAHLGVCATCIVALQRPMSPSEWLRGMLDKPEPRRRGKRRVRRSRARLDRRDQHLETIHRRALSKAR